MTDRELMQMALDALDTLGAGTSYKTHNTAKALRDRLAQPEREWVGLTDLAYRLRKRADIRRQIPDRKSVQEGNPDRIADLLEEAADALDKQWVGLTDEEVEEIVVSDCNMEEYFSSALKLSRQIEAKLKEKNS